MGSSPHLCPIHFASPSSLVGVAEMSGVWGALHVGFIST